jgi:hypothetical protein
MAIDPRIPMGFKAPEFLNPMDVRAKQQQIQAQDQQMKAQANEQQKKRAAELIAMADENTWGQMRQTMIQEGLPNAEMIPDIYHPTIHKKMLLASQGADAMVAEDRFQRQMENDAANRRESRADRWAMHGATRQDRLDAKAEKRQDREETLAVPGYERTGEVLQRPEEAQKMRNAVSSAEQLQSKLQRLRDLVGGNKEKGVNAVGSFEWGGTAGQEMESLATEIQLLSKNEDMYQLGVLTGPDMGLLQKITADPSSLSSMFTRDSTRLKQIDTQLKSVKDKLASTAKSRGYRPADKASSHTDTKIVDGRTYTKVKGGWELAD